MTSVCGRNGSTHWPWLLLKRDNQYSEPSDRHTPMANSQGMVEMGLYSGPGPASLSLCSYHLPLQWGRTSHGNGTSHDVAGGLSIFGNLHILKSPEWFRSASSLGKVVRTTPLTRYASAAVDIDFSHFSVSLSSDPLG